MNFRSLTAGAVAAALTALALVATPTRAQAPTPIRLLPGRHLVACLGRQGEGLLRKARPRRYVERCAESLGIAGTVGRQFEFVPSTGPIS